MRFLLLLSLLVFSAARVLRKADQRQLVITQNGKVDDSSLRTEAQGSAIGADVKVETFVCSMIHFEFAAKVFQVSVGVDVRVGIHYEKGEPSKIFVMGTMGGGMTIGPPTVNAIDLYVFRYVTWEAWLPPTLRKHMKTIANQAEQVWPALKWVVRKFFQKVAGKLAFPRLAAKFTAADAGGKLDKVAQLVMVIKNKLKDDKEWVLTDDAAAKGVTIEDAIKHDLEKQAKDALVILGQNLIKLMEEEVTKTNKGKLINAADHKKLVQRAYMLTFLDNTGAMYQGDVKGIVMSLGGMIGQKKSPDCTTVHEHVESSKSSKHKPGFYNILCSFMSHGMLLKDTAIAKDVEKGQRGYKNTLKMIEIVLESLVNIDDLEGAYGGAKEGDDLRKQRIARFIEAQGLGKVANAMQSTVLVRPLATVFADAIGAKGEEEMKKKLQVWLTENKYGIVTEHRCDEGENVGKDCGFTKRTVEWVLSATAGFGGDINLCTPDTSILQYHYMRRSEYNGGETQASSKTRSHKFMISGTPLFQAEFTKLSTKDYKTNQVVATSKSWSGTIRVMIDPHIDQPFDTQARPPAADTQGDFDKFFAKHGVEFARTSIEALTTVAAAGDANVKDKFVAAKKKFLDAMKKDAPEAKKKLAAPPKFKSVTGVANEPLAATVPLIMSKFADTAYLAVLDAAAGLKAAFHAIIPASLTKEQLLGMELTLTLNNDGKIEATGGLFYFQYWKGVMGTSPWTTELGFDVKGEVYKGYQTSLEITGVKGE